MNIRPRILHISTCDNLGGSGRSAYRIHEGLRRLGVQSRMFVSVKATSDPDVALIAGGKGLWFMERAWSRFLSLTSLQDLFYPSSFALPLRKWFRDADVIQIYNTHGGYFSHTALPLLSRRRPVVWRLSDMWPMTGHCVYPFECERWKKGCGECPSLSDYPALRRDTTALLWNIKRRTFGRSRVHIVAPSRWIAGLAKESPLLGRFEVSVISNGLDTEVFRPIRKEAAREVLNIAPGRKVIMFSADFVSEWRKGGLILKAALDRLAADGLRDVTLLVVGNGGEGWSADSPFETRLMGRVANDELMAALYSAADVFVLPTLADNLPNGLIESMACGTPCVTFDVGGCPEAVRHMETGYVARAGDAEDLARGIGLLLADEGLRTRMGDAGRKVALEEYSLELQARRFARLYEEIIGTAGPEPSGV